VTAINGILIVDKPQGWTSHDVVKKTRNLLGVSKVGHTGTLDPMATGVEVTFGRATDTYDSTGKTTATGDPTKVDKNNLRAVIARFEGESKQIPPMFSAVKVGGKKLYQLARAGKKVECKPRKIVISRIKHDLSDYPIITLDIECSRGTYIRSIAHQLGEMVGCHAHLSALRRTASGDYTIKDAVDFLSIVESGRQSILERSLITVTDQEKKV